MKRIFVGIPVKVNDRVSALLDDFYAGLGNEKIKWVDPKNFHLTIKFIGDSSKEDIQKVRETLRKAYKDLSVFQVCFTSAGVFKSIRQPRVLWIGVKENENLRVISNITEAALEKNGIPPSDRAFHPHLTFGRVKYLKNSDKLKELINKYDGQDIVEQIVNKVVLFESKMTKKGVEYEVVEKIT